MALLIRKVGEGPLPGVLEKGAVAVEELEVPGPGGSASFTVIHALSWVKEQFYAKPNESESENT